MDRRTFVYTGSALALPLLLPGCRTTPGGALREDGTAASVGRAGAAAVAMPGRASATSVKGKADLAKYARAYKLMQADGSWERQANIHNDFCPHGNWFFLPWHRVYLIQFEQAIRDVLNDQTFALPYWDWGSNQSLPAEFLSGPLAHQRQANSVSASAVGSRVVDSFLSAQRDFVSLASGVATSQREQATSGALETGPHNHVHATLAGDMGTFLSPRDPIFWLHHGNIDRIWYVWSLARVGAMGAGGDRPPVAAQRAQWEAFSLQPFNKSVASVLDVTGLPYGYAGVTPPPPPAPPPAAIVLTPGNYRNPVTGTTYAVNPNVQDGRMTSLQTSARGQSFSYICDDTNSCRNSSGQSIRPLTSDSFQLVLGDQTAQFARVSTGPTTTVPTTTRPPAPRPTLPILLDGRYRNPVTGTIHTVTVRVAGGAMTSVDTIVNGQLLRWTCGADGTCVSQFQQTIKAVNTSSYTLVEAGKTHTFTRLADVRAGAVAPSASAMPAAGAVQAGADAPSGTLAASAPISTGSAFNMPSGFGAVAGQIKVAPFFPAAQASSSGTRDVEAFRVPKPRVSGPVVRLTLEKLATKNRDGYFVVLSETTKISRTNIEQNPGFVGRVEFFGLDHHGGGPLDAIDVSFDISERLAAATATTAADKLKVVVIPINGNGSTKNLVVNARVEVVDMGTTDPAPL